MVIASAAPPSPLWAGEQSADANAADGGISGFPKQPAEMKDDSAWCVAIEAEQSESVGDIAHLEYLLQNNRTAEGAMLFQTLPRLREALATQVTRRIDIRYASDYHSNGCSTAVLVAAEAIGVMAAKKRRHHSAAVDAFEVMASHSKGMNPIDLKRGSAINE